MARAPVLAAGGIVTKRGGAPLIAVVRLRKRNEWVLPKGKLDDGETPRAAAEREVLEETGHLVSVHEFLGTLAYEAGGRPKVVHYWRMEANREQTHALMDDVRAVAWLPLDEALERLSRDHEREFLTQVGPLALEAVATRAMPTRRSPVKRAAPPRLVTSKPARKPTAEPTPAMPEPVAPLESGRPMMASPVDVEKPAVAEAQPTLEAAAMTGAPDGAGVDIAGADGADADMAAEMDMAEADMPALAPERCPREYPVAPRSALRSRTMLEKAWLWLRGQD
jgi:8-oxo-dGTP diphosphatase